MNNSSRQSACGKDLFSANNFVETNVSLNRDENPFHQNEATFLVENNSTLYLQLGVSNNSATKILSHKISRNPADLQAHIQRIALQQRLRNNHGLYGALVDLFIALGEHGTSIRNRMLNQAKPYLSSNQFHTLDRLLKRGIRSADPLPNVKSSVLSKGYTGRNNFIVSGAGAPAAYYTDARKEANDCMIYGQVDEARHILESAVIKEPWRNDLQTDLLEIYWATRDLKACQAMYSRLDNEFITDRHAWINTAERISDAMGNA